MNRDEVIEFIKKNCVKKHSEGDRVVTSDGKYFKWSIDFRNAILNPDCLFWMCREISNILQSHIRNVQVAAIETTAVPFLGGLHCPSLMVRGSRKTYGTGKLVEGMITGAPVYLLDDILNSGKSADKARQALSLEGIRIRDMIVLCDFERDAGKAWARRNNIKVHSIFKLSDFDLPLESESKPPMNFYAEKWSYRGNPKGTSYFHMTPKSAPLIEEDRIYFGADNGSVHCVDRKSGDNIWTFREPNPRTIKGLWSSVAHHNNVLYFGTYNGNLYALNAFTGEVIWQNKCCDWIGSSPVIDPESGNILVSMEYGTKNRGGSIACFDWTKGTMIWEYDLKVWNHGSGTRYIYDRFIFGTNDHTVLALNSHGNMVWEFPTKRSIKYAPGVHIERGLVAAADFGGTLYINHADTGVPLAEHKIGNQLYTTPLLTDDFIYCGSDDGCMYILDYNYDIVSKEYYGGKIHSSPQKLKNSIIFGTTQGRVFEIDAYTHKKVADISVPDAITNKILVDENLGLVYVMTYVNDLYCFQRYVV